MAALVVLSVSLTLALVAGRGLEKRQTSLEVQYRSLIEAMPLQACSKCPWVQGSDCCRYIPYGSEDPANEEERFCAPGLGWDVEACTCNWPGNIVTGCEMSTCVPKPVTTPDPGAATTTTKRPKLKECPFLKENECCLPEVGQWFTKLNDTHYRLNDGYPQGCPEGMTFNHISCCCEGLAIVPNPCKHWTFDRTDGNELLDSIQQTFAQSIRASIVEGRASSNKGVLLEERQRVSIPYFSGAYFGKEFSLGFWVKTSSDNTGSVVLSNGNRLNEETIAFVLLGNAIAGGIATELETPPNTYDMEFYNLGGDGWHFIALTYSAPELRIYVDQQLAHTSAQGGNILSNSCQLNLGGVQSPSIGLDELAICEFTWDATDVANFRDNSIIPQLLRPVGK